MELQPGWKKYCVSYPLTIYPCWWLLVHSGHEDSELIAKWDECQVCAVWMGRSFLFPKVMDFIKTWHYKFVTRWRVGLVADRVQSCKTSLFSFWACPNSLITVVFLLFLASPQQQKWVSMGKSLPKNSNLCVEKI